MSAQKELARNSRKVEASMNLQNDFLLIIRKKVNLLVMKNWD